MEEDAATTKIWPQEEVIGRGELFLCLDQLLHQMEELNGCPEPELRGKIEALCAETVRVPSTSGKQWSEVEIAKELDNLSTKLGSVDQLVMSTIADPHVHSLLNSTADIWMPAITASMDERCASNLGAGITKQNELQRKS